MPDSGVYNGGLVRALSSREVGLEAGIAAVVGPELTLRRKTKSLLKGSTKPSQNSRATEARWAAASFRFADTPEVKRN
jgi:hypothetical protein